MAALAAEQLSHIHPRQISSVKSIHAEKLKINTPVKEQLFFYFAFINKPFVRKLFLMR
jgi:hypothetical protein